MQNNEITIRETSETDLENILLLWNNGEVMHFVGFPNGIGVDLPDRFRQPWSLRK